MPSYADFLPSARFQRTLALSPDERTIAYADGAAGNYNVTVRSVAGGGARQLTNFTDKTVRRVAWHPAGLSLALTADSEGDEKTQVYITDGEGGFDQLTDTPDTQNTLALGDPFSPDGRRLAFTANDRSPGDQDILTKDLKTGEVQRIYVGGGRVFAGHWSPTGTHLTATEWVDGNSDHIIYLVPADGGPAVRLTHDDITATYWLGPWLPDGSGFLVLSNAGREFTGLGVLSAATGELGWLDTPEWDVEAAALSADGRLVVWLVNVGGASQLHARDMTTGADVETPTLPAGVADNLLVSSDGRTVAFMFSTATRPWNVVVVDLEGGELRWLTDAKPVGDVADRLVEPILVQYPTSDGSEVPAYLYRPQGSSGPVGVLISIHGGPTAQERPVYRYEGFYQYMVSNGIAVLTPNGRGSDGYGKSYIQRIYRDWGGVDLVDVAAAVAYLRQQPWVDQTRIGLYGFSYGGFVVLSSVARLPQLEWACAVVHSGPSNLVTLAKASPPTLRSLVAKVIGDPHTDTEALLTHSPVTYADQIVAPLLVIQGANDPRVPRAESDQIVERLRARGAEVSYDVYPDEGHVFVKTENIVRSWSDAGQFLIPHLSTNDLLSR